MHDHPRRPFRPFRPARLLAGTAALAAATTIAACGSSSPIASSSSVGSISSATSSTVAFSECMRTNGVPNFPDLRSEGMRIEANGQTLSVNGVSVTAPAFLAARMKCERYVPHVHASQVQAAQQRQRGLQFARCMRSHDVPNFPDPKLTTGPAGQGVVDLRGAALNFQSPAFQAAAKACGGGPKGP